MDQGRPFEELEYTMDLETTSKDMKTHEPLNNALTALNNLLSVHRTGNQSLSSDVLKHLRDFDAKLTQLEIKVMNLRQLKKALFKDIESLVYHYLMPAQSDEDIATIDIFNVPDGCIDDPITITCNIGRVIGYPVTPDKIRGVHRSFVKRKNTDAGLKSRTMEVQFYNVRMKWEFLRAYRTHITVRIDANTEERQHWRKRSHHIRVRHILSSQQTLSPREWEQFVFVDDHIGPFVRRLFMQVSNYCQKVSVPMVWVNNSKIYVRRGKHHPAIRIKKFNQIVMIKSLANKYTDPKNFSRSYSRSKKWFTKWNAKEGYKIP